MAEYVNVKIIGVDPVSAASNVIARSSTGGGASGAQWQLLNVHSLGNLWVNSLSGGAFASMTAIDAFGVSDKRAGIMTYSSASGTAISAVDVVAFLKIALDNGQGFAIPLYRSSTA